MVSKLQLWQGTPAQLSSALGLLRDAEEWYAPHGFGRAAFLGGYTSPDSGSNGCLGANPALPFTSDENWGTFVTSLCPLR